MSKIGAIMQTSLERIAEKAKRLKKYRFRDLYRMLNEEYLHECWKKLNKNAAVGIDEVSHQEYGENLTENIRLLVERLKQKKYKAKLVRRQYIPKGDGKMRPLGIPAIEDKLLQYAVMQILQAIFEQDFFDFSYGYRPKKGALDAVRWLKRSLQVYIGHVVEADIKGFFDNISHEWMIRMLEQRINDRALLRLIKKWLKAGVLEPKGEIIHPLTGTPQGGIISPILANIYMHYALNLWFEKAVKKHCKGKALLCVYADDFVAAFQHKEEADKFYNVLGKRLEKFGLMLSMEKTKIVRFSRFEIDKNGTFEFLGFEFRWVLSRQGKPWIKLNTSKKKLLKSVGNFKNWCNKNRSKPLKTLVKTLKAKLRGYYNYYGVIGNYKRLGTFYHRIKGILFKWLNRRSQRTSYKWNGFNEMLKHFEIEPPRIIHDF